MGAMVPILGNKSGFKNARDLILFMVGLGTLVFHLTTATPDQISIPLLMFAGGLMGAPYVLGRDEKATK